MSELAIPMVKKVNGSWFIGKMSNGTFKGTCECENRAASEQLLRDTLKEYDIQSGE